MTKLDRLPRSFGDLLEIVAGPEAKKVSLRVLPMSGTQPLERGNQFGIAKAKVEATIRAVCRPHGVGLPKVLRLNQEGVRPSEIASRLGSGGPASILCLACKPPVIRWLLNYRQARSLRFDALRLRPTAAGREHFPSHYGATEYTRMAAGCALGFRDNSTVVQRTSAAGSLRPYHSLAILR